MAEQLTYSVFFEGDQFEFMWSCSTIEQLKDRFSDDDMNGNWLVVCVVPGRTYRGIHKIENLNGFMELGHVLFYGKPDAIRRTLQSETFDPTATYAEPLDEKVEECKKDLDKYLEEGAPDMPEADLFLPVIKCLLQKERQARIRLLEWDQNKEHKVKRRQFCKEEA
jgi:hypothetical protein